MSKTAQRKRQAYQEGLQDGAAGRGYRWSRHPYMAEYRFGYVDGLKVKKAFLRRRTWWYRSIRWICRKLGVA